MEAMPGCARLEDPVAAVGGDLLGVAVLPILHADLVRYEGTDVVAAREDLLSDFDGKEKCVSPKLLAGIAFVDPCIDVECGEELVEG